jgi:hypothetical protein
MQDPPRAPRPGHRRPSGTRSQTQASMGWVSSARAHTATTRGRHHDPHNSHRRYGVDHPVLCGGTTGLGRCRAPVARAAAPAPVGWSWHVATHSRPTAIRLAALIARLGEHIHSPLDGSGAVAEVYPAAALKVWGLPHRGYKRGVNAAGRNALVDEIQAVAPWLDLGMHEATVRASDDALDAVVCALAAVELEPRGSGELEAGGTIPVDLTSSPYNLTSTLNQLTETSAEIDKEQLAQALEEASSTFSASSPDRGGCRTRVGRIRPACSASRTHDPSRRGAPKASRRNFSFTGNYVVGTGGGITVSPTSPRSTPRAAGTRKGCSPRLTRTDDGPRRARSLRQSSPRSAWLRARALAATLQPDRAPGTGGRDRYCRSRRRC